MNIFKEIKRRITLSMRRYLEAPADHPRPQDDVPNERVLHYIVKDYRRMYLERQTLIDYSRALERIYKETQVALYRDVTAQKRPTRKRLMQNMKMTLFDMTQQHMAAQDILCKNLGIAEGEAEDKKKITDKTISNYGRTEQTEHEDHIPA